MNWEAVAAVTAIVAVLVTVMSGMALLIYRAGKHTQRLDAHEAKIAKLETTQDEHSRAISAWDQALRLLEEVRGDVKALMTGRISPPRRARASED